ncbi:MAG: hypothetical protein AB8B63_18275 [Granulosicoccus sp.]
MTFRIRQLVIVTPLVVFAGCVWASEDNTELMVSDPFAFDATELDSIRFTRSLGQTNAESLFEHSPLDHRQELFAPTSLLTRQTEVSFKLRPKRPRFSREGAFGLDLFTEPRLDVRSHLVGPEQINSVLTLPHRGFEYSAGLVIEHEDEQIDGTAYVSSSLLGLSYGRMGRLWYGGFDVNLAQIDTGDEAHTRSEVLSLDVTTGRRLGFTGLDSHSPLWLLSLQGNLDMNEWEEGDDLESSSDWFLNPSMLWQQPGFTFSAQMQLPVELDTVDDSDEPDYRLRAVFEKHFK